MYHAEMSSGQWFDFGLGLYKDNKINRIIITPENYNESLSLITNQTPMVLPFEKNEEWYVFWGGDTEEDNYHVTARSQKNAIDFVIKPDSTGRTFKTDGKSNDDYYAFGRPIFAPAKGQIISVTDGVNDNIPGKMNPKNLTCNKIIMKTDHDEYVLLAHFKKNSIQVRPGDIVSPGDVLGLCGNSGKSSEPHLHLQLMDKPVMKDATGIKILFQDVIVDGNAQAQAHSPIRGTRVKRESD